MPTVRADNADIYYEIHGEGPALAFAHGRGGNAASWWQQVPKFSESYKVIVFDHRVFGRSKCAPENFDRSVFHSDFLAILDAEGIESCGIVCQSMGGWTGLKTAVFHSERISCLVLSNTPGGMQIPAVQDALMIAKKLFAEQGISRAATAQDFSQRNPEKAYLYQQISSLNINLPEDLTGKTPGGVLPSDLDGYAVPTLMITSENDKLFPPELIREVSAYIPGSQVIELPAAGHSPYFETPEAFNEAIATFLRKFL